MTPIPFISLAHQHAQIRTQVLQAITEVYDRNWFVLGKELTGFEKEYADFSGAGHCVGVGNGLDALFIALKACGVGPGDDVVVPAHTFLATWLAVLRTGAKILPVEPEPSTFNINAECIYPALTPKTKAIIPVHLYGQPCDMTAIKLATDGRPIFVIEDNAQAHGAAWDGKITGSIGDISATSFYPVKNLGALGDGGAIVTDDNEQAEYARRYRNYGFKSKNVAAEIGVNSRLDEIQAAVLRIKLKYIERWYTERINIAKIYLKLLEGVGDIQLPGTLSKATHVFHLFVIKTSRRDELRDYLAAREIETGVHYPVPPHLQSSFKYLGYSKGDFPIAEKIAATAISLPLWPGMESSAIEFVCEKIREFFNKSSAG